METEIKSPVVETLRHTTPRAILLVSFLLIAGPFHRCRAEDPLPKEVPVRRSTQLSDGFGVNLPLPREPRLPWDQKWWTHYSIQELSGFGWVSTKTLRKKPVGTGWNRSEMFIAPEVDEAVRSPRDNGISIEMQLCYGNPLYHGDPASRRKHIDPAPTAIGPQDHPPNPIFNGLDTEKMRFRVS